MDELTLYQKFLDINVAHTNPVEWLESHGFGVGYLWHMQLDSFDQTVFRKNLFYSEKWFQSGKHPEKMKLDFPFCLMLPVKINNQVKRNGELKQDATFTVVFYIFDLLYQDRNQKTSSSYALRSKEEIWNHTSIIGRHIIQELNTFTPQNPNTEKFLMLDSGEFVEEKVYDWDNRRLAGTQFEFRVEMFNPCTVGVFDYARTFPKEISVLK